MLTVIDYDAGNLRSVETALKYLGADFRVSSHAEDVISSDKLIFPGVGEAAHAMGVLKERGLDEALREAVAKGIPTLGICIGSQILLDSSEEATDGMTPCLAIEGGTARFFTDDFKERSVTGLKVPHMGWNQVHIHSQHPAAGLFDGIKQDSSFYFVHSYYPAPKDSAITLCTTDYGFEFVSAYGRDNLVATQFHPEKSGPVGLRLLENFISQFGV